MLERQAFFLIAYLVERLYSLKASLAALLVLIGAKMVAARVVGKIGPAKMAHASAGRCSAIFGGPRHPFGRPD